MKNLKQHTCIFIFLLFTCLVNNAWSTNYTWTGSKDHNWADAANWSPLSVPTSTDNVTITSTGLYPELQANVILNNLTVSGNTLDCNNDTLTVNGTGTFSGGTVKNGLLKLRSGTDTFSGTLIDIQVDAVISTVYFNGSSFTKKVYVEVTTVVPGTSNGGCTFYDSTTIYKSYTSGGVMKLANSTGNIYNGPVKFINAGTTTFETTTSGGTNYNNNVTVESTGTGGINIGSSGGGDTLASGKTISIGSGGFTGILLLRNFTQLGSTSQSLTLSGANMNLISCTFNGAVTFSAASILLKQNTLNATSSFTHSGNTSASSDGGNTFNAAASFYNTGTSNSFRLGLTYNDVFNDNVTCTASSGGEVRFAYNDTTTVKGNVTFSGSVNSGYSGTGVLRFAGSNAQTFTVSSHNVYHILMDKTTGNVTMSGAMSILGSLNFVKGNLITTSSNLITMNHGSTTSGANNNSFVSGPIKKVGNASIVFPTGKGSSYRAIEMSAPGATNDAFTGEYFAAVQTSGYAFDTSLHYLNSCQYWQLARNQGTSNVTVKLYYDSTSCGSVDSATLRIANWNSTQWKDLGNGGITGNRYVGKIANSTTVAIYGYFTLANNACFLAAHAGSDQNRCSNATVILGGSPTVTYGSSPVRYRWSPGSSLADSTVANPAATPGSTTNFIVTITDTLGCSHKDTTVITYRTSPTASAGADQDVCEGDSITLGGSPTASSGSSPYTYNWTGETEVPPVANPKITPDGTGNLVVTVTDVYGCMAKDTMLATLHPLAYTSENSSPQWSFRYAKGTESNGYSIEQTADSSFIVCGSTRNLSGNLDIYLFKIDSNGDTVWTKTIGSSGDEEAYNVHQAKDGGYIVSGYTTSYGAGGKDFYVVKTNGSGTTQWTQTYGDSDDQAALKIVQALDSGYVAIGYTDDGSGEEAVAVKLTKTGSVVWDENYGETDDPLAYSLCATRDSGFVLCTVTGKSGPPDKEVVLTKIDKTGSVVWDENYAGDGDMVPYAIYACEETGFVIAGTTETDDNGTDMLLMKVFDDGTLIWQKTYGGEGDEVAYDVRETNTYSFILSGTSTSNEEETKHSYIVNADDYGNLEWEASAGTPCEYEGRSIAVAAETDFGFAMVGTLNTGSSSHFIHIEYVIPCYVTYPRGIWFGQCWQFDAGPITTNKQKFMLNGNSTQFGDKLDDFVEYCVNAKIHTVVLAHLEDIIREDNTWDASPTAFANYPTCNPADGDDIRERLQEVISTLHHAGVPTVLAQWLDQTSDVYNNATTNPWCTPSPSYESDEEYQHDMGNSPPTSNNEQILDAFIRYNTAITPKIERFDGLMLDYEYFSPTYGDGPGQGWTNDYQFAEDGIINWKILVDKFIAAKAANAADDNGIRIVQAYLNYIYFTDPDVMGPISFEYNATSGTDETDTYDEIRDIDAKNLDAIVLAFPIRDFMSSNPAIINNNPIAFLKGQRDALDDPSINSLYRYRLETFGNNPSNKRTHIIPWFRSINKVDCSTDKSWLGDYLLGQCYWAPVFPAPVVPHYLADVENEFINQFFSPTTSYFESDDPPHVGANGYGDVSIRKGFQGFQYGLNDDNLLATSHDLPLRANDAIRTYYYGGDCVQPRLSQMPVQEIVSKKVIMEKEDLISVLPNPFSIESNVKVPGEISKSSYFTVRNMMGSDVTTNFSFSKTSDNEFRIHSDHAMPGIYLMELTVSVTKKYFCKFVIMN